MMRTHSKTRRRSRPSVRDVIDSTAYVTTLDDLRRSCGHYDPAFFEHILKQLEEEQQIVVADGKVFPIREPIQQAEIIPFPGTEANDQGPSICP